MAADPIVERPEQAAELEHGAALVLEPLREFLDREGIGSGPLEAEPIGEGHSNLSFLLRRDGQQVVLRRPPLGELAPSANDVLREARVLEALAGSPVPVPDVLAQCEDEAVIGAPFFLMAFVAGEVVIDDLPPGLDGPGAADAISDHFVERLVELHETDLARTGLDAFGRPNGYLERQVRLFGKLLEANATRPLPDLERIGEWLEQNRPESQRTTFVHGDYRLGNVMLTPPDRVAAVLDWEMATVGDPLADLGYATAMWAEDGDEENPMVRLSRVTRRPDFPGREELARRYAERTGCSLDALPWYQALALWKSAIFLEGSYARYRAGASADEYFADLGEGVPAVARAALAYTDLA